MIKKGKLLTWPVSSSSRMTHPGEKIQLSSTKIKAPEKSQWASNPVFKYCERRSFGITPFFKRNVRANPKTGWPNSKISIFEQDSGIVYSNLAFSYRSFDPPDLSRTSRKTKKFPFYDFGFWAIPNERTREGLTRANSTVVVKQISPLLNF